MRISKKWLYLAAGIFIAWVILRKKTSTTPVTPNSDLDTQWKEFGKDVEEIVQRGMKLGELTKRQVRDNLKKDPDLYKYARSKGLCT